jgi:putative metallopeptidase
MSRRRLGTKKAKRVNYRFIEPQSDHGRHMYALLRTLIAEHHPDLRDAKIALAWQLAWKPDADGRLTLGMCRRVGDLERELHDLDSFDFVIILHEKTWVDPLTPDIFRRALIDHELCHAAVRCDIRGEPEQDERGRTVYRTRKHDLEEFACIAARYGCWKSDITAFGQALERARIRTNDHWVGYRSLQCELREAGLPPVAVDTIAEWTDDQRREAATYASLQREMPERFRDQAMPPFLAKATQQLEVRP